MDKIDSYKFGQMEIDNKKYTDDLILQPDEMIESSWWRKEGHLLHKEDLDKIMGRAPAPLVIGRGYSGRMKVPQKIIDDLEQNGFDVKVAKTTEAVDIYNNIDDDSKIGAFHLNC